MTIQEIINILQKIALTQPNVSSVGEGDIYDTLNAEASTRYAYFFITQNRHQQTEDTDRYSLNIFYIDRLTDDKSNKLQIQSIGKEVLGNVFNTFCEDFDIEVPTIEYQVFTERFSDYCAGVYATVAFEVMREGSCADYYDGKYEHLIPVKIINQTKQVKFTANGMYDVTYDRDYTGLENVEVEVDVDVTQYIEQGRQEGYNDGYAQGETEGYGQGYANGYSEGETKGYDNGYSNGYSEGETKGYDNGYSNGYSEGETEGISQGIEQGISQGIEQGISQGIEQGREQVRNEAEDLYLTENGVYEGENLYKRVEVAVDVEEQYNKGYQDGANAASADAIVLDVTTNGTYYTKFAELPEWTEPETGDGEFYSYITAIENALSTGYKGDTNTVVELWYRHYGNVNNGAILQRYSSINAFKLMLTEETGNVIIGSNTFNFHLPAHQFNKIRFSTKGIWVNDEQVSEYDVNYNNNDPVWEIGGIGNLAQGDYGMIKIDDNVYIPTADGFLDTATNEILPSVNAYSKFNFTFTELIRPVYFDNLIKQVNVTVPIKAYDKDTGVNMSFQCSNMTAIPDNINFEGKTNWYRCFEQCSKLKDITALRNIKLNNAENVFQYCSSLTDLSVADTWDFSDCTNMGYMFANSGIVDLSVSSYWDTSKVTNMGNLLNPSNLVTVGTLDCTSITGSYIYSPLYFSGTKLKNLGGFLNIKISMENSYSSPAQCPNLTKESYINIFNGLYDFTGNGEKPNSSQGKIKLHSNAYTFLTDDDIAIATNKGWTVS